MFKWASRLPVIAIVLSIGGVILLLVLFGPVADWYSDDVGLSAKERADVIDATRRTLLQAAAGLLAVGALVYTARTYLLVRDGQLTDRFTRAVEQLGAATVARRVGGVFALARVMRESKNDQWAVIEVLTALIRERSALPANDGIARPRDVQAALTVLGKRPRAGELELDRIRLGNANLRYTLLRDGRLDKAAFRDARLDEAHWERTSLVEAEFRGAILRKADFEGVVLRGAWLEDADLRDAKLTGADLAGARMTGAHLSGVRGEPVLSEAQLTDVHCRPEERCHKT
jgi:hypothetical protein